MSETGPHVNTSRIVKGDCLEDTADSEDAESHAREGDFATETERELHTTLEFFVNGRKVSDPNPRPEVTLLEYLRRDLRLCGSKLGCGEGGCGACTVMVSFYDSPTAVKHFAVNACLAPVVSMHGKAVTTVEGIGSIRDGLHPVQERLANAHGSQCGFCTPGIVMSMYTLLRNKSLPAMGDIKTSLQGNLCRCTGYRPILDGFKSFSEEGRVKTSWTDPACRNGKDSCCQVRLEEERTPWKSYDPTQDLIFPPELKVNHDKYHSGPLKFESKVLKWFRPATLTQLLQLKHSYPEGKIVVGNTELGVEMKFKDAKYPVMIQPSHVKEMTRVVALEEGLSVGAAVTLSELEAVCREAIEKYPKFQTEAFVEIQKMLHWFAGPQIRNVSAVGGNIATGSPISDLNPIFMATRCKLVLQSLKRIRTVYLDDNFFTGYRSNIMEPDEILVSILIPFTACTQHVCAYKQSRRREDDIAIVTAAFMIDIHPTDGIITDISMAYGGMGPKTCLAQGAMQYLTGKEWNTSSIESSLSYILDEFPLSPDVPGGQARYRMTLAISLFYKAFLKISHGSGSPAPELAPLAGSNDNFKNTQLYELKVDSSFPSSPVGKPQKHLSADKHTTGEAVYIDDMHRFKDEHHLGFVLSTKSHAIIRDIDFQEAKIDGVVDFLEAGMIPKQKNNFKLISVEDEVLFAEGKVKCAGQVVAAVVAKDHATAQKAAKLVRVRYEDLEPILTIQDAIKHQSFHKWENDSIVFGNPGAEMKTCSNVLEGSVKTGAQEHFYLETNACLAVPVNAEGEMHIYSSTQSPTDVQLQVSNLLGCPMSKIMCHVKRLGGGFGGKESRSVPIAMMCALAAERSGHPVRVMLDRDEDMRMTGYRHPFLGKYKVGFNLSGKIQALQLDLFSNSGYTSDLSFGVMERALLHCTNGYSIANLKVTGFCCKTNTPSNTAFRGFGCPQAMIVAESIVDHVASYLKKEPWQVRELNMLSDGDVTHFNQIVSGCTLLKCWEECMKQSNFLEMKCGVNQFNAANRWKKRGISIIPVKYGIAFSVPFLNQSGALVHVYKDGSVLLSHGGTEMGQGLHTKMVQVASKVLSLPMSSIFISDTSTSAVPNTSATAASSGTDLNGMAVKNACETIMLRIEPYKNQYPNETWKQWVVRAYHDSISLSATGYYSTPDLGYDFKTNTGNPFNYTTYGAGCSLVEIDCLSGDHSVLKTDIVMDLGESLNPAIDIGQVEGAFIQGYGMFVMEEILHSPSGQLLTQGPGTYKIPSFGDIPSSFNVTLLKDSNNPRAIFSSKAVGEPPLFLASSVYFAIKDAIRAARGHSSTEGQSLQFQLEIPATCERIRMACDDHLSLQTQSTTPADSFTPWAINI